MNSINPLSPPVTTGQRLRTIGRLSADRLAEVAGEHGYRIAVGGNNGWTAFRSMSVQGEIALGMISESGPFLLCVSLKEVADVLDFDEVSPVPSGYSNAFVLDTRDELFDGVQQVYQQSQKLSKLYSSAWKEYQERIQNIGLTEGERNERFRIGQTIFRNSLLQYWNSTCPLTGITDQELLRASHIVPWSECAKDEDRLCIYNGLLLSSLWDAAFDRFLITFSDVGVPLFSKRLTPNARNVLVHPTFSKINLQPEHRKWITWHRQRFVELDLA